MRTIEQKGPRGLAGLGAGGKRNVFYAPRHTAGTCRCQTAAADALRFVLAWDDTARRFLSSMFADPQAGYDAGSEVGLTADSFPRPELWIIARYLCAAAEIGIQPTIRALILATEGNGEYIGNGNPADLAWLDALAYDCAANVEYYSRLLVDFAKRRRLADLCRKTYSALLGMEPIAECVAELRAALKEVRAA